TVAIPRVARESGVAKAADIRTDLSNLRKARAAIALAALDLKAVLVVGVVRPGQVYLTCGNCRRRQVAWSIWNRRGRRCWCRRRSGRRRGCRRPSRRWCWRRSWRGQPTALRKLERTDARAPVEAAVRRYVFLCVPESAVVYRVHG